MYEERRETISIRDIILQVLLIILFVLLLIWIFPTKGYFKKWFNNDVKTEETTKIEASSDDIDRLAVLYNQIFANNIYAMKEAAIGYYTNERLPQTVGDTKSMTLGEMYEKHLVLKLMDKDGNYCDEEKSYVSITKYEDEFQMKVNLSCGDIEDYIIVYLGCYDYCDATGVCEKQVPVTPSSNSNIPSGNYSNPTSTPSSNKVSNPTSVPSSNKQSNPTSTPNSNPTSNPTSTPNSNPTSNPTSTPNSNPTSNPNICDYNSIDQLSIIFNTMGGNKIDAVTFNRLGNEIGISMPVPVRNGYVFEGWYADSDYTTKININSSKSKDIDKLSIFYLYQNYRDNQKCIEKTVGSAVVYAKWSKNNEYVCEYNKQTGGYWGSYGDWSQWSTQPVASSDSVFVETETRREVTGYKYEQVAVGTKLETYIEGYEDEQYISGYNVEKYIEKYQTKKVVTGYKDVKYISDYKEEKYISGYKDEQYISGYKNEKYVSGYTTQKYVSDYKEEKYISGYNYEKYVSKYVTQKVKVGTEKVQTGTTTKTTTEKVPAGTTKVYVKTSSGYTVPSNTSNRYYEVIGTKTSQSCSGCVTKTVYTWREYKIVTLYKSQKKTETVPVYSTVDKYEERKVPVYATKKVPVYSTKKTPIYETKQVPVYDVKKVPVYATKKVPVYSTKKTPIYSTKKVPVYGVERVPVYATRKTPIYSTRKVAIYGTREVTVYQKVKVSIYSDVTYYRYRVRKYFGGTSETRWSTCDPVDSSLLNDGFTLTGNRKEV